MARVVVDVMLKPEILDPQGRAVIEALPRLGIDGVRSIRVGKRFEIEFEGEPDLAHARELADRLLANPVIEDFEVRLESTGLAAADPAGAAAPASAGDAVAAVAVAGEAAAGTGGEGAGR